MFVRSLRKEDYDDLKQIHSLYYEKEFEFPNFVDHFLCGFAVEDEDYGIISAGGVRTIAECIALTDQNIPIKKRREALYQMLRASIYAATKSQYNEIHAFVQDEKWLKALLKHGFNRTKGQSVVMTI